MIDSMSRRQFLGLAGTAAAVLGLGLTGCGLGSSDAGSAGTSAKKYTIAMDTVFAPFEYTDENGDFVGIDVDIITAIAEKQGFEVELKSVGFDAALSAVESEQADGVIAGMCVTEERKATYDFSDSYYDTCECAAAKKGSGLSGLDDLRDQPIAVKTGDTGALYAEEIKDEYGFTLNYFDASDLMYQDVLTGNSVACFEDYPVMAYGVSQGDGLEIIYKDESSSMPYAFAVKKGKNQELLEAFNKGLQELKDSGELDEIIAKYLG